MNDNVIVQFPAEMRRLDDVLRQVRLRVGRQIINSRYQPGSASRGEMRDIIGLAFDEALPSQWDDDMVPFAPVAA